jgi:hypothetical protein
VLLDILNLKALHWFANIKVDGQITYFLSSHFFLPPEREVSRININNKHVFINVIKRIILLLSLLPRDRNNADEEVTFNNKS